MKKRKKKKPFANLKLRIQSTKIDKSVLLITAILQ